MAKQDLKKGQTIQPAVWLKLSQAIDKLENGKRVAPRKNIDWDKGKAAWWVETFMAGNRKIFLQVQHGAANTYSFTNDMDIEWVEVTDEMI